MPGVTLNLSMRGVSTSVGVRGAHLTAGTRGTTVSAGIPGTGLRVQEHTPWCECNDCWEARDNLNPARGCGVGLIVGAVLIALTSFVILGVIKFL
jgi:hypothetical protein